MKAARYLLALAMITTGALLAHPDDVAPQAQRQAGVAASDDSTADGAPDDSAADILPSFVAPDRALTMPAPPSELTSETGALAPGTPQGSAPDATDVAATSVDRDAAPGGAPVVVKDETKADPAFANLVPAKKLFGKVKGPSLLQARAIGSYSRGCLAGGVALPVDGPAWQAMRLSRNRNWGHPKLINLIQDLAVTAQKIDGWRGLLVGDLSQPRGGPMLTGHSSHQLGLDADVWLTQMPARTLTRKERENISAVSMLDKTDLAVDPKVFTGKHVKLIKRAASYPEVERVLVHPAIKKALCVASEGSTDRAWLGKVRPIQGHYYHFHIRIGCPPGSVGCVSQKPITGEDGCTKEVDEWLVRLERAKLPAPPKPPGWKPPPPKPPLMLTQLPADCKMVLESGADGVVPPPEALVAPPRASRQADDGKGANVILKPVKERRSHLKQRPRSNRSREARAN